MRKITVRAFVACSLVFGSLAEAQTSPTPHANMTMPGQPASVTTVLSGPLGSRSASGSATVTGRSVQLVWTSDTPGSVRAWAVRSGSCNGEGSTVGAAATYSSIAVDAKGNGGASVTLDAPLNMNEAFHVAVRASSDLNAERLACGSLSSGASMVSHPAAHGTNGMANLNGASDGMAGMDHSKMPGMDSKRAGMDSTMGTMDHGSMNHSSMSAGAGTGMSLPDSASLMLMAIHHRMMADPVIRERVMTDPTLQRMMERMHGMGMTANGDSSASMHGTKNAPAAGVKRSAVAPAKKSTVEAPAKSPAKASPKTPSKETSKTAPPPMPGMDHSKMPGMKKPPV